MTFAVAPAVLAVILSACTATPSPGAPTTPPAGSSGASGGTALSESMQAVKECIEDAGLVVHEDGMGGLYSDSDLTAEQNSLWLSENERCSEESGLNDPYTDDELRELYALEVANHQCLLDNEFESADPPSEQAYIDSWRGDEKPYDSTDVAFYNGTFRSATAVCASPRWSFG